MWYKYSALFSSTAHIIIIQIAEVKCTICIIVYYEAKVVYIRLRLNGTQPKYLWFEFHNCFSADRDCGTLNQVGGGDRHDCLLYSKKTGA